MTKRAVISVKMPEGNYRATVSLRRVRKKTGGLVATVRMLDPIPFPTTNGEVDRAYGLITRADSAQDAVAKLAESVLEDRGRYGGKRWRP